MTMKSPRSLLSILPLLAAACTAAGPPAPAPGGAPQAVGAVPAAIAVPSGHRLASSLRGSGWQHYECRAAHDAAGGYAWVFVAPDAVLKDANGAIVGRHLAGPAWEHGDGSRVTGEVVASAAAPQPGAIPWLLLRATAAATPGTFARTTYVQRTRTDGGVAPSDPCGPSQLGTKKAVRYTADYLFFD